MKTALRRLPMRILSRDSGISSSKVTSLVKLSWTSD